MVVPKDALSAWYASDVKLSEWLNQQDIELAHWEPVESYDMWGNEEHDHQLVPYEPDEVDAILERYLRNVRKIYGDQPAAKRDNW